MEKKVNDIKKNILAQAKYYLENADEFYPFGAVINKNNELQPIGVSMEEEHPSSVQVLDKLENYLKNGLAENDYFLAAIGLDVFVNVGSEKKDALEIRIYSPDSIIKYYFTYSKLKDKYYFEEHKV